MGDALAKFPEVAYAMATTGPANLAACAVCRSQEELYEFLTDKVGALPGVERVETAPIIRTVKQASPVASRCPEPLCQRGVADETESGTVDSTVSLSVSVSVDEPGGVAGAAAVRRGAKARPAAMQANGMTGIR